MRKFLALVLAGAGILSGNLAYADDGAKLDPKAEASEIRKLFASGGYLKSSGDGALGPLSVPPPASDTAAAAYDVALSQEAVAAAGGSRWEKAIEDADLRPNKLLPEFFAVAGLEFSAEKLPNLDRLIRLAMVDFAGSTSPTKKAYARPRPFMVNGQKSCTPDWEAFLRQDGSYPSGHSAIGWGAALILSDILPDKSAELLARGQDYGDSRRICNVHWNSDILLGRTMATNAYFQLKANAAFEADLMAAKAEMAEYRR